MPWIITNTTNNLRNGIYCTKSLVKYITNIEPNSCVIKCQSEAKAISLYIENMYARPEFVYYDIFNDTPIVHYIIDGSYRRDKINNKKYVTSVIMILDEDRIPIYDFRKYNQPRMKYSSLYSEIMGALFALNDAQFNDYRKITIHYDCDRVEKWVYRSPRRKSSALQKRYHSIVSEQKRYREIKFSHMKGHENPIHNLVDNLTRLEKYQEINRDD